MTYADTVTQALSAITDVIAEMVLPNTVLCARDGCLVRAGEPCPACDIPRECECGRKIRHADHDRCHVCRAKVPRRACTGCGKWVRTKGEDRCYDCRDAAPPKPPCTQCGRRIRTVDQTRCSPCRRNERSNTIPDEDDTCPVRWIRRGLIWHPVYEQREVA